MQIKNCAIIDERFTGSKTGKINIWLFDWYAVNNCNGRLRNRFICKEKRNYEAYKGVKGMSIETEITPDVYHLQISIELYYYINTFNPEN